MRRRGFWRSRSQCQGWSRQGGHQVAGNELLCTVCTKAGPTKWTLNRSLCDALRAGQIVSALPSICFCWSDEWTQRGVQQQVASSVKHSREFNSCWSPLPTYYTASHTTVRLLCMFLHFSPLARTLLDALLHCHRPPECITATSGIFSFKEFARLAAQ